MNVKEPVLVAVPPAVVTRIGPLIIEDGTFAVICVALLTTNEAAGVPLNETANAPMKLRPVMTTGVPDGPDVGLKLVIAGADALKHLPELSAA